jgi:serine/threonine protein kinase
LSKFQQIPEAIVKKSMQQLLSALSQIHKEGVIHRDIKLDNILLGRYGEEFINLKIADLGLADYIDQED